jgi:hypothetical protein
MPISGVGFGPNWAETISYAQTPSVGKSKNPVYKSGKEFYPIALRRTKG